MTPRKSGFNGEAGMVLMRYFGGELERITESFGGFRGEIKRFVGNTSKASLILEDECCEGKELPGLRQSPARVRLGIKNQKSLPN